VIADAAILLSTSDVEGFPNTFVQAWSSGTPVVSIRIDPDNIIEHMRLGAVVGNSDRAVHEIAALMHSPERRDAIAARAIAFVRENYGARRVVGLFNRAVNGTSRP
jgi:glycosyltransferase involved in cell wall biosynthesis